PSLLYTLALHDALRSYVARPAVGQHRLYRFVREALLGPVLLVQAVQKMIGKHNDVIPTVSQGGKLQGEYTQAMIEVLAQRPFCQDRKSTRLNSSHVKI